MTRNYAESDRSALEFVEIAPAADLAGGERLFVEASGRMIVVFNIAGTYFAIADVCSHDDGPVGEGELQEYNITCPRHGAQFDIRTGAAKSMPAVVDIAAYPVEVRAGMLYIGLPSD